MALEPQAALETAVRNAIRSSLSYPEPGCDRTFNGQPPPRCPKVFVAVWAGGRRRAEWRTALLETFSLAVTITVQAVQPYDRWVIHRDDLELRANAISNLIHKDTEDYSISNAAEVLASYDGASQPVGFREGLAFEGYDDVQTCGPDWFHASLDSNDVPVGLAQTIRFGGVKRLRRTTYL